MPLNEKLPEWNNRGSEPSQKQKDDGFGVLEKPSAGIFNWFFHRIFAVLGELKDNVMLKEDANNLASQKVLDDHITDFTSHTKYIGEPSQRLNDLTGALQLPKNEYFDGLSVSFKCKTDTTGAARLSLNSLGVKHIKNTAGVNVTNLKAGSIYSVRYSSSNDSFILQGEGREEGTATASDVLGGKTISTASGLVEGAIPVRKSGTITPGRQDQQLEPGYYPGTITVLGDTDLIPGNIRNNVNLFGVVGTMTTLQKATGRGISNAGNTGQKLVVRGLGFRPKFIYTKLTQQEGYNNMGSGVSIMLDHDFAGTLYGENFTLDWNASMMTTGNILPLDDGFELTTSWPNKEFKWIAIG